MKVSTHKTKQNFRMWLHLTSRGYKIWKFEPVVPFHNIKIYTMSNENPMEDFWGKKFFDIYKSNDLLSNEWCNYLWMCTLCYLFFCIDRKHSEKQKCDKQQKEKIKFSLTWLLIWSAPFALLTELNWYTFNFSHRDLY